MIEYKSTIMILTRGVGFDLRALIRKSFLMTRVNNCSADLFPSEAPGFAPIWQKNFIIKWSLIIID